MKQPSRFRFLSSIIDHLFIPRDRLLSAFSVDGINWKREKGVRKQCPGYPASEMVYYCFAHQPVDFDGDWEIYYHSSSQNNGKWIPKIMRARSHDGLNWLDFEKPALVGPIDEIAYDQIRSPNLINHNESWRLFFSARGKDKRTRILSTSSLDRIEWQDNPEVCINADACNRLVDPKFGRVTDITDPCVINLKDGTLRMYFSTIHGSLVRQNIASARSQDGIDWEVEQDFRLTPGLPEMANCVCNPSVIQDGNFWRIYFRGADDYPLWSNIFSAKSADGLNWNEPKISLRFQRWNFNERNAVAFPFVTRLGNESYRMYYTGYWGTMFDGKLIKIYSDMSKTYFSSR